MKLLKLILVFCLFSSVSVFAQLKTESIMSDPDINSFSDEQKSEYLMQTNENDIVFIENLGQITDSDGNEMNDILFHTRLEGVDMYVRGSGMSYVFRKKIDLDGDECKLVTHRLDMEFTGANKNVLIEKENKVVQKYNYFTAEYPDGISPKAYRKICIKNLYNGIDLIYYKKDGRMKYDFLVKAGANAENIKMKYKGAEEIYLDNEGNLIVTTSLGEIREEKPYTFFKKSKERIGSSYKINNKQVSYDIIEYRLEEDIIIDPYRVWATFYGGSNFDGINSAITDNFGNLYVAGDTWSTDLPLQIKVGAYNQGTHAGGTEDLFIIKFNSNGVRQWATFYGGNGRDTRPTLCTDISGNLYVTGITKSSDFPKQDLPGAYYQQFYGGGNWDAYIIKFDSASARLWATYYGGNENDYGNHLCTDNTGTLYVTGFTHSDDFPVTPMTGAYNQDTSGGYDDVYILKFDTNCAIQWATYYGGNEDESAKSICCDNNGNIYLTGEARGSSFPTYASVGAYNQMVYGGGNSDAFILKFDNAGVLQWSTFYGDVEFDKGIDICSDNSNSIYVTGTTHSPAFPLQNLSGAYNQATHGGNSDAYILKFDNSNARLWATYYGGNYKDDVTAINVDNSSYINLCGTTESADFPVKSLTGAYNQSTKADKRDAFILRFNNSSERLWATYYGDDDYDDAYSICNDLPGNTYVCGGTFSDAFPIQDLNGAYNDTTLEGDSDAFILKFSPTPVGIDEVSNSSNEAMLYQNFPNPADNYTTIKFSLEKDSFVKIVICDLCGKEVLVAVEGMLFKGEHDISIDVKQLKDGIYFYKLITKDNYSTRKMIVLK